MRYIRSGSNLKQNKQNFPSNNKDKQTIEQLKLQLKSIHTQINLLKQVNNNLLRKLQISEKQKEKYVNLSEELQFLREQEFNFKKQMENFEEIHRKMRQQLERTTREKVSLADQLKTMTRKNYQPSITQRKQYQSIANGTQTRINTIANSKSTGNSLQNSLRGSLCNSSNLDLLKQNHYSTPKSKMKINLQNLIPQNINQRRKVFL